MVGKERIQMSANEKQVAGEHYKSKIQHWDYVVANDLDYFQAQITKYVTRWKKKNGYQDLLKAQHFLEKYIELEGIKPKEEKYPDDYQEQLSFKMEKMRQDAMTGIPEHLREEMMRQQAQAISPMLKSFWGGEEPLPEGYVDQDR
jgi:hypothetical protein